MFTLVLAFILVSGTTSISTQKIEGFKNLLDCQAAGARLRIEARDVSALQIEYYCVTPGPRIVKGK